MQRLEVSGATHI